MKNITFNLLLIASVFIGSIVLKSCDEPYTINTKKMISDEQELMTDYLNLEVDSSLTVEDTLAAIGDTINKLEDDGYLYFELEEGSSGDSVRIGKDVGYRYTYFEIVRDTTGVPFIYPYESNMGSEYPVTYKVGNPDPRNGIFSGIDLAIRHMNYGTKARVFVSSSLWRNDYTPRIVDLEVTYVEK